MSTLDSESISDRPSVAARLADVIDRIPLTRSHRLVMAMVLAGVFFDVVESNTLGIAGPSLIATWGVTKTQVTLVGSVTFVGMTIGGFLAGALADRRGRSVALTANLAVYSLGSLLCAFAPSIETLAAARFVVGIGLGGELAVAITLSPRSCRPAGAPRRCRWSTCRPAASATSSPAVRPARHRRVR